MNLVFDIEANGLLQDVSKIHCIGIYDIDTGQTSVFNDEGGCDEPITRGVTMLEEAECLIGHNIINYDLPALSTCYPFFDYKGQTIDTLILSHVYHANILDIDKKRKWKDMPANVWITQLSPMDIDLVNTSTLIRTGTAGVRKCRTT